MKRALIALAMVFALSGCDGESGSEGGGLCLLGGQTGAEVWHDGQKVELLATATMGKWHGFQGYKFGFRVDQVELQLSIENYPEPKNKKDQEECVHKLAIYVCNPAVGDAEPELFPQGEQLAYRVTYTWGNADWNEVMDNFGGHLSGESRLTITEYADGYISGTFRFVFDNVVLEDGRFTHIPIAR